MSQSNPSGLRAFVAAEALEAYRRVKLNASGLLVYADEYDDYIGTTEAACASGATVTVRLKNVQGTRKMILAGTVAAYSDVFGATDGKIDDAGAGPCLGKTLDAGVAGNAVEVATQQGDPKALSGSVSYELFDDFFFYDATEGPFIATGDAGAGGTTDVIDGVGGIMSINCDGDDNDEKYLNSVVEGWKFAADKPFYFEARVAVVEGSTNKGAYIVGLMDAASANALVDDEAGPKSSYSGIVLWKVSGGLTWSAEASVGATQTPITLSGTGVTYTSGATAWQTIGIAFTPTSSTAGLAEIFIDGLLVGSASFTYTGATEMEVVIGCKSDGTAEETILVDYVRVRAQR